AHPADGLLDTDIRRPESAGHHTADVLRRVEHNNGRPLLSGGNRGNHAARCAAIDDDVMGDRKHYCRVSITFVLSHSLSRQRGHRINSAALESKFSVE